MTDDIYEIPAATLNFRTELAAQLAELVPEAVADGKVDVAKLQELLASDAADGNERFGLFWPGKKRALRAAQEPTTATLKPDFDNSRNWDTTKNAFIEGDNLEVLKVLQKHYHGKIKLIYIDPPYNTGQDLIYPDNFVEGLGSYLEWTHQVNSEGRRVSTNSETEGRFHSNWLNMMYPRLKLARDLLRPDGLIAVSIDDKELPRLTMLLEELFGGQEVKTIAVKTSEASGVKMASVLSAGRIPKLKEYLVLVKRDGIKDLHLDRTPKDKWDDEYKTIILDANRSSVDEFKAIRDNPERSGEDIDRLFELTSTWRAASLTEHMKSEGVAKDLRDEYRYENAWRIVQIASLTGSTLARVAEARSRFEGKGDFFPFVTPREKVYLIDAHFSASATRPRCQAIFADDNLTVHPGDFWADIPTTGLDNEGGVDFKNGKKPIKLIERLIRSVSGSDFTVLDFFAGSGTTAEATLRVNESDGGSRNFILVQLPEPVDGGGTVADITRQRLSNMFDGRPKESGPTYGFRSYSLIDTSFSKWRATSDVEISTLEQHLLDLRETSADGEDPDTLLVEILLKLGFSLTEKIASALIEELDVRVVGDNLLIAYLNEHVKPTHEQLRAVVDESPARIIVLEDAFHGDDGLKTNLAQLCRSKGIELWTA